MHGIAQLSMYLSIDLAMYLSVRLSVYLSVKLINDYIDRVRERERDRERERKTVVYTHIYGCKSVCMCTGVIHPI